MKFSKKGQIKIGESLCIFGRSLAGSRATALAQLAFEPDDFDGVVVLSVKGAKDIASKLGYLAALTTNQEIENDALELQYLLLNRIEQVEKENASN